MIKVDKVLPMRPAAASLEDLEKKTQDAAKMYEKLFLREMVKAMRQTVPDSGLVKKSQTEAIFKEQLDGEYVESWGEKGGIGLSDMIYNQIVERFGVRMGMRARPDRPHGPLPLNRGQRHDLKVQELPRGLAVTVKNIQGAQQQPTEVLSPWKGTLVDLSVLEDGRCLGEIAHDNGLQSKFLYEGSRLLATGSPVEAGQKFGLLSPTRGEFLWQVQANGPSTAELVEKNVSL